MCKVDVLCEEVIYIKRGKKCKDDSQSLKIKQQQKWYVS